MTKRIISTAIVICIFLLGHSGGAQKLLNDEMEVFTNSADAEKIYLQLSGSKFNTSETIWFKAIITNVIDHKPTKKSGVLHVELIDLWDKQILDRNLLKINNGIADGFFQLHSSYREGKYMIRAYTEWNKNFGSDFITSVPIKIYQLQVRKNKINPFRDITFTKDYNSSLFSLSSGIAVKELDSLHTGDAMLYMQWENKKDSILLKLRKKQSIVNIKHKVPLNVPLINYQLKTDNELYSKSIVLNDEYGSLQFFPEGGALVEGLQSAVGFKYLDYRGKGLEIQGIIEDEDNNKICEFESNPLGMGKFILLPKPRKTYYGVLTTTKGDTIRYKLPKAKKQGLVLGLIHSESYKTFRIWNKQKNRDSLFVKFFHRGKNLFKLNGRLYKGMFSYKIEPEDLPHGVIGLTVFDKNHRPIAERHFFNQKEEENLSIEVMTDKELYYSRDSVQISIKTKYKNRPISASVSLMAIDSSYFYGTNLERNNIVSYFLLQSDIKGKVENPSYYFENNRNLSEIDYLMLTQGWSNYKYNEKKKPRLYKAERGLEIRGKVENVQRANKQVKPVKKKYELNMLLMGEPLEAYVKETDYTGSFNFRLAESHGYGRRFVLQPTEIDSKIEDLKIKIDEYQSPEIAYGIEKVIVPVDSIVEKKMTKKIEEDIRLDPFILPNAIALDEVVLSDYKITPERAEMVELHGIPDVIINNAELLNKQKEWTKDLYRWLLFNSPKAIRVQRLSNGLDFEVAYVFGAEWTYVVIDGIPVHESDYNLIGNIPVSVVKSVEIFRNTNTANNYFKRVFDCAPTCPPPVFPAILVICTFPGQGLFGALPKTKSTNLINSKAPQFTPIREYYVPEYHNKSQSDDSIPDRRRLLYWKPNPITNTKGEAKSSFFNSDITGKMLLFCEAITLNGKIGYSVVTYEVVEP